ncbi:MAG: hypothetical protein IJX85_01320 [Lachnospiraceae bacterium]|nr:hypothetical protein [Lachnospiraceae bacterium]
MEYYNDQHRYDDIINLPHYQSDKRAHMSLHDRAAQFAPFAALTGHEEAIEETARLTENEIIIDESQREQINQVLSRAVGEGSGATLSITYFKPDKLKTGGAYLTDIGIVKKVDTIEKVVIMESGMRIGLEQIVSIEEVSH